MQVAEKIYQYLKFCNLSDLQFWDYYTLSNQNSIISSYPITDLGNVIKQRKGFITINDDKEYKRCRVQISGNGVIIRDSVLGKEIKIKKQQLCKKGDFLVASIDAKVGGFGIVPQDLEDAIVSGHYFLFEIDTARLLPDFLGIIVKTNSFQKQVKSTGSTNYAAIRPYHVLGYKIPLPPLVQQEKIVRSYYSKIDEAERLNQQANDLESEIERYFLKQLGLTPFSLKKRSYGLQTIDYADLDRWDYFSADISINSALKKSVFTLSSIGQSFEFVKRSFNKSTYPNPTFKYIEIGAIDPIKGILEAKEIATNKAPSRATQFVKENDLIIGTTRPYLKKFAIVTNEYDKNVCSSGFSVIASNEKYHLPYLLQFLNCTYGVEQLKNRMSGGLYPAITESELKEIKIPFPKVEQQIEIMKLIAKKKSEILNNKSLIISIKQEAQQEFEQTIFS